jgi:hypothetical protein
MSSLQNDGPHLFLNSINRKILVLKNAKLLAATACAALAFGSFYIAYACGPFSLDAIFTFSKHPDYPLEKYAQGELGLLQPTYARSYLFTAYRHLNGTGFLPAEQKALLALWKERQESSWMPEAASMDTWLATRKKVAGIKAISQIDRYRNKSKDSFDSFLNCTPDAFETAAKTLEVRITKFRATSPEVKDWTLAQDRVFSNCSEGENIPESAPSNTSVLVKQDRAYQIASANFYAMKFDDARTQFEKIAEDTNSPWRTTASLLIARTLIRRASLQEEASRTESLSKAEILLNKTLADPVQEAFHKSAQNLLKLVKLRLNPKERLRELAQLLASKEPNPNLKQDLWDYTLLLDKYEQEANPDFYESIKFNQLSKVGRENDMTDWVLTFQAQDKEAMNYALRRWEQTASMPWLIASLSKGSAKDAKASKLMKAALAIKPDSPAFLSANAQLTRLLLASGQQTEAKKRLDFLLNNQAAIQPSARNYLLHQRMLLASNLDEFLKFAQRKPTAFSWDYDDRELPAASTDNKDLKIWQGRLMFDSDAISIINERLPLSVLTEVTSKKVLPDYLRQRIALAAWTRAALLEDSEQSKALAPLVSSFYPELKSYLDSYLLASTAQERKVTALYILLKFPALRPLVDPITGQTMSRDLTKIDNYRGNWWCAQETKDSSSTDSVNFLNATQQAAGKREHDQIAALGSAPNYLSRQAVEWAKKRTPNDSRVPEALHLAVRSTRYGCTDKQTGRLSKAAFDLLKTRYASSPWAKKTKYWFKG